MAEDKVKTDFKYNEAEQIGKNKVVVGQGLEDNNKRPEKLEDPLVNWTAANAFNNSKKISWYFLLTLITLGLSAGIYFLTKDKITTGVILVCGLLLAIYAAKKPKQVKYELGSNGFTVNGRYHNFGSFRSFSIVHNGTDASVVLTPLKRFVPFTYIYFKADIEPKIVDALTSILPRTTHSDIFDRLLQKIGF